MHANTGIQSDGGEEEEDAVIQFGTFDFSGDKPVPNYLAKKKKLSDSAALRKALKDKERIAKLKSDESTAVRDDHNSSSHFAWLFMRDNRILQRTCCSRRLYRRRREKRLRMTPVESKRRLCARRRRRKRVERTGTSARWVLRAVSAV